MMNRQGLARESDAEDLGHLIHAARLHFEEGLGQVEIAARMQVSQSTVSRWLTRAAAEGFVVTSIRPPSLPSLEYQVRRSLEPEFRSVRVLPPGPGKNLETLGDAGAELLLDAIQSVQDRRSEDDTRVCPAVRITFSSGETLRVLVERFVTRLRLDDVARRRIGRTVIELYPAALYWSEELHAHYPGTLVTTLWTEAQSLFAPGRVRAFAPVLPRLYYDKELWRPENRNLADQALELSGARRILDCAAQADIFVLAIGTLDEPTYPTILNTLGLDVGQIDGCNGDSAEFVYVPLREGALKRTVEERLVRVGLPDFARAAHDSNRWVIGIAGGKKKVRAMCEVLSASPPVLNALVTDSSVAEGWLQERAAQAHRAASASRR